MLKSRITTINLDHKLRKLDKRYHNTTPLMRSISEDMLDAVEENFEKQGRPKWKPLTAMTQKIRNKTGKNGPILQPGNAGGLASSINNRYTERESFVGTNKKYAKYIQDGTEQRVTKKQRNFLGFNYGIWLKVGTVLTMPARPFLKLTSDDVSSIKRRIGDYFTGR